jgi:hypothetical protein
VDLPAEPVDVAEDPRRREAPVGAAKEGRPLILDRRPAAVFAQQNTVVVPRVPEPRGGLAGRHDEFDELVVEEERNLELRPTATIGASLAVLAAGEPEIGPAWSISRP